VTPGPEGVGDFPVAGIGLTAVAARSAQGLAQYRWLLGHHVAFGVWALLASTLEEADRRPLRTVERSASLFDAYSAALRYAGSCTPATYATAIRPVMAAADPAFSGRWASGFSRVDELLARLPEALSRDPRLVTARRRNASTHQDVGRRILPAQPTLLQANGQADAPVTAAQRECFDRTFRTERADVCRTTVCDQLIHRLEAVDDDLVSAPLGAWLDGGPRSVRLELRRLALIVATVRGQGCADLPPTTDEKEVPGS
jgi:hypothetical protein